jgi:hypothetical protein
MSNGIIYCQFTSQMDCKVIQIKSNVIFFSLFDERKWIYLLKKRNFSNEFKDRIK